MENNIAQEGLRRESFVFFTSWLEGVEGFPDELQAEVVLALMRYCAYGAVPDLSRPHVRMAYIYAKETIDRSIQNYLNKKGKKKEGETNEEGNENETKTNEEGNENEIVTSEEGVNTNTNTHTKPNTKRVKYVKDNPPTREEVEAYAKEKGYVLNVDKFFGYYESQGWKKANGQYAILWKGLVATFADGYDLLEKRKHTLIQDGSDYGRFNRWLLANTPYVAGHFDSLLSENQFRSLKFSYGTERLTDVLFDLENRHDWCDKCSDLNTTLINWLNKDNGN